MLFPEVYLADRAIKLRYSHHIEMLQRSDLLLSVSESAKADAISKLGYPADRSCRNQSRGLRVFRLTTAWNLTVKSSGPTCPVSRPYVFTVMGEDPRKNLDG